MKTIPFKTADILLPKNNFEKWSCIACDQFTSNKKYWNDTEKIVGDYPSTLKITLPEIYLDDGDTEERITAINSNMLSYMNGGIFEEYKDSMIYIERIQPDGRVRRGIIGAVDLEEYDYKPTAQTLIRATEGTVIERLPPRVKIRKDAPLELPHIMLLIDDAERKVIEHFAEKKASLKKVYDFDLMMGGGHITGYLLNKQDVKYITEKLEELCGNEENPLLFAVGDGNHSLATAKECYELIKSELSPEEAEKHPARYALAEVGNIHSSALDFEPIYRVMFSVEPENVVKEMELYFKTEKPNAKITYTYREKEGSIDVYIPEGKLTTGIIQEFIDEYLRSNRNAKVDYIHGEEHVKELSSDENAIGFIYDGISKDTLFSSVKSAGALPRKTFSMGESRDKRYYLECRKIK